jgi:ABC-type multidrug transport system fused ATPase/permease subunit
VDKASSAVIAFDVVSRGFVFYVTLGGIILMLIGMELGVWKSTPLNAGLYAVTVIFLVQFSEFVQIFLMQSISVESLMISSERAFQIINLQAEKELRNDYDREIGLEEEVEAATRDEDFHLLWPRRPSIEFANLSAKYKEDLPLILRNIGFTANVG